MQNVKSKMKEVIAAPRRFHHFDFCCLIFAFPVRVRLGRIPPVADTR
jgi:hypothetical protein